MKNNNNLPLEPHRRIPLIRITDQTNSEDCETDTSIGLQINKCASTVVKKVLNIPICDVTVDHDYNKDISATFKLPASYVKHIKKIGDETDVTIEYVLDKEDETWLKNLSALSIPKEQQRLLTAQAFECIINILERYTGFSKDPIPQLNARKIVIEELRWDEAVAARLLHAVYCYWLSKREKIHKPLCRRYWPQVTSSDTNPHQVFRTRDKERYRLRKQQKRNDVEAFRKMQQLRKEFSKAQILLQLVLERELLSEARFTVQREIFEQQIRDTNQHYQQQQQQHNTSSSIDNNNAEKVVPYRYKLRFEDLIYQDTCGDKCSISDSGTMSSSSTTIASTATSTHHRAIRNSIASSSSSVIGRKGTSTAESTTAIVTTTTSSSNNMEVVDATNEILLIEGTAVATTSTQGRKSLAGRKRKRDKNGDIIHNNASLAGSAAIATESMMYTIENGVRIPLLSHTTAINNTNSNNNTAYAGSSSSATAASAVVAGSRNNTVVISSNRVIPVELEGPATVCQPLWPSFMESNYNNNTLTAPSLYRSQEPTLSAASQYMEDLEFRRYDYEYNPNNNENYKNNNNNTSSSSSGSNCNNTTTTGSSNNSISSISGSKTTNRPVVIAGGGSYIMPSDYATRCRIGRGGRLFMDRIPLYSNSCTATTATIAEEEKEKATNDKQHFSSNSMLRRKQQQGSSEEEENEENMKQQLLLQQQQDSSLTIASAGANDVNSNSNKYNSSIGYNFAMSNYRNDKDNSSIKTNNSCSNSNNNSNSIITYIYPTSLHYQYPVSAYNINNSNAIATTNKSIATTTTTSTTNSSSMVQSGNSNCNSTNTFIKNISTHDNATAVAAVRGSSVVYDDSSNISYDNNNSMIAKTTITADISSSSSSSAVLENSSTHHHHHHAYQNSVLPAVPLSNTKLINYSLRQRSSSSASTAVGNTTGNKTIYYNSSSSNNSNNNIMNPNNASRIARIPKMPPFVPTSDGRLALSAEKCKRLREILQTSEVEEESKQGGGENGAKVGGGGLVEEDDVIVTIHHNSSNNSSNNNEGIGGSNSSNNNNSNSYYHNNLYHHNRFLHPVSSGRGGVSGVTTTTTPVTTTSAVTPSSNIVEGNNGTGWNNNNTSTNTIRQQQQQQSCIVRYTATL